MLLAFDSIELNVVAKSHGHEWILDSNMHHFMLHLKNIGLKTCMNMRVVMLLCTTTLHIRSLGLGTSLLNLILDMS